jgi:DNA invertase Pin-like site-specific DNA recombinase
MNTPLFGPVLKVTPAHLARDAYLYIRQSSLKQVLNNTESTVRQYGLKDRAIALGWPADRIIVIDNDQGQSGASATDREGFQRLVAEVGMGRAGIVLGLEVSRLARNNTDWHRLLEICAMAGTLILDEDGLYDPCDFNDRLLLGLKGTMSEAELHLLKARLRGGQLSKARRGELVMPLPIGLVYTPAGTVALDPDQAVRRAIEVVFDLFDQAGSATGVVKAMNRDGLRLPRHIRTGPDKGKVVWGAPAHSRILQILHNPRYAGAFFYGRYQHRVTPGSGKCGPRLRPRDQWVALFPDAHPGYISFAKYEANEDKLAGNAVAHGQDRRHGPPREGPALLQGIVICGRCGARMTVRYHQRRARLEPEYVCQAKGIAYGNPICQRVHGAAVDDQVAALLIGAVTPLALETALNVADELAARADQADTLRAAAVERARYHAELARRRYLAVDPDNRLVAVSLEADWNAALRALAEATETYEQHRHTAAALDAAERERVTALAADFPALWKDPKTPDRERKRLARLLITDVTLIRDQHITAHVRLTGGQEHTLTMPIPLASWQIRQTPPEIVAAIDHLLDQHTDGQIAAILTAQGHTSGSGQPLQARIIQHIRTAYHLRSHPQRLAERGMVTLREMARRLNVCTSTVKHWRDNGLLTGQIANDKGEYYYHLPPTDLPRPRIGRPPGPRPPRPETTTASTRRRAV